MNSDARIKKRMRDKIYREAHKEEMRIYKKNYYQNHKDVLKEQQSEYVKNRPEETRIIKRRYYDKHKLTEEFKEKQRIAGRKFNQTLRGRISQWRRSAAVRNLKWEEDLNIEYFSTMPLTCYYTGQELTLEANKQNTISLDRLDNNKPYEKGNIVFCCAEINYMKRILTKERFVELCHMVSRKHFT